MKFSAGELLNLVCQRHSDDVFVDECKDGPTQIGSHRRLDAWAMKRSWAHPKFSGYEIKVSRSDWLKDGKFHEYLPLCNELWIVAPNGIVELNELPQSVGMLVPASTGSKLMTKRKATYRQIDPPIDLLVYILMCRVKIGRRNRYDQDREERAAEWKKLCEEKESFRQLGYKISRKLHSETVQRVEEAEQRAQDAERRMKRLEEAAKALKELGVDWERSWYIKDSIRQKLSDETSTRLKALLNQGLSLLEA